MQQLSELDASFLYLETESAPMHIGGVYILDSSEQSGELSFEAFRQHIESRLPAARQFRQRLVEVPLKLGHPYWVDDPDFDISNHLRHAHLPSPGAEAQLLQLTSAILAEPLNRERPLWEITLVDGYQQSDTREPGCRALIVKIHHSVINGATGEELMSALLDFSPEPSKRPLPQQAWNPNPLPSKARLIGNVYGSALNTPFRLANMAKDAAASAFYTLLVQRLHRLALPPALFSAPPTSFNRAIGKERSLGYFACDLDRLKQLKKHHEDITLNDVVMTLCSEVLTRYLHSLNENVERPLIAVSPISVRSKRIDSPTGSQLSAMLISLATNEPNLAIRLKSIHDNATSSQIYGQAISAARLTQLIPSSMLGLSARIYTEFQLAQRHKPLFNIPITNIPGPQTPLYFNGTKVTRQLGSAPLFDGLGLSIVVVSYNGEVTFTLTSNPKTISSPEELTKHFESAITQLEKDLTHTDLDALEATLESNKQRPPNILAALLGDITALFSNLFFEVKKVDESREKQKDVNSEP
ncbi:predicted membrane-associated, metal-dependent hydrolase [Hahella chejuensis KCTC 2396]|uniref:diacylglycerol O-acyltransferase n=1 Tax=Hahella chejuensis (strain KCTC 2396) TaxID=349521 RepID=Q2S9S9_HAHCH|nr:wax ester/triacylglycerol synthase family O-acyltransferase [Hahella chejuensis]ABC32595.1 predicted membrane-associated, metal-dependent hydrolase [Hahella chejuensis KCTC 2396]